MFLRTSFLKAKPTTLDEVLTELTAERKAAAVSKIEAILAVVTRRFGDRSVERRLPVEETWGRREAGGGMGPASGVKKTWHTLTLCAISCLQNQFSHT
jgi:hypothetical protein